MTGAANSDEPEEAKDRLEPKDPPDRLQTFAISESDARSAARLLRSIVGADEDRGRELTILARSNVRGFGETERSILVERARRAYVNRSRRAKIFDSIMFGEAAWDMLLALYVTDRSDRRHTISGLCNLAGTAATTALRWLKYLEAEQLVIRKDNPTDQRVYMIELSDKGRDMLDVYFSGVEP